MKKPHALIGLLAALGTAIGVLVAVVGLPYGRLNYTAFAGLYHGPTAFANMQFEVDCDTLTVGVQNSCTIDPTSVAPIPVEVVASNWTGLPQTLGAFAFDLFNPSAASITPGIPQPGSGLTVADWAANCAFGGQVANTGTGPAGSTTSFIGCFTSTGGQTMANGASLVAAKETYADLVVAPTSVILTLSNVVSGDDNSVPFAPCNPSSNPPVDPTGIVSGPCFPATLNFAFPPPTFTPTTAPPTNTPTPTNTPLPTNTPTNTPTATATPAGAVQAKQPDGNANNVVAGPAANLWLCNTCGPSTTNPGEGSLVVHEVVSNVQTDGGVGLGAYEFNVEFDPFVIQSVNPTDVVFSPANVLNIGGLAGAGVARGPANCTMSIVKESSVTFGCVTVGQTTGPSGTFELARLLLKPTADDVKDTFPGNDNGINTIIKDNGCELADRLGHPVQGTVNAAGAIAPLPGFPVMGGAGLLKQCSDLAVTLRILEGDIDLNCKVDVADEQLIAQHYGATFGSNFYDKWYDLEPRFHDLDVDIKDLQKVFGRDGSTCQNPIPAQLPIVPPFSLAN